MNKLLVTVALLSNLSFAGKEYCGPDSIICRYESMFDTFKERSAVYPMSKPLLNDILVELFDGRALKTQIGYVQTIDEDLVEVSILFLDPILKIDSTKILVDGPQMKKVRRVFTTRQVAYIDGKEMHISQALVYTLTKEYSSWKISEIQNVPVD